MEAPVCRVGASLPASVCAPPADGRVKRNLPTLPIINPERLRTAKALVDKAVKLRKVFSVQGAYPVVRGSLRARGWVERHIPHPSPLVRCRHRNEEDQDNRDDSDGDDRPEVLEKPSNSDDLFDLMSRLVRNETTYFYWTTRRDEIDCHSLRKEQMTNHYAKAGSFTTKVGLCVNLRNLHWFDEADPDTFFPRCYRLGAEDEKQTFIEDFCRTACTSLLQVVVERGPGEQRGGVVPTGAVPDPSQSQYQKKSNKHRALTMAGPRMIDTALKVCQDFLDSLDHRDIDIARETPSLTEQQWAEFIYNYYLIIHNGVTMEDSARHIDRCRAMLQRLRKVCPQLETDGIHNIWIVKPGAKSRGRGILCFKYLDDILKLVDSDPALIKDSKWVVQKYLERPLLIHGTKFDLRQWFLVTDWNPLTVWFYNECYLRFSTQPYSVETLDSSVHLCNNSIQKHFPPSQHRHPEVPEDSMWSCEQFRSFLGRQGRGAQWEDTVVPGMRQAVVHALQTAQDLVESRQGSFELYGADFMLGRDLRPWLIEINASPTMAPSTAVTARLCAAVQEDTLRVVLDHRLDCNADTGGFELIYKQPAVEVPQYVGVNLLVEGASLKRSRAPPRGSPVLHEPLSIPQTRAKHPGQNMAVKGGEAAGRPGKTAEKPAEPPQTASYSNAIAVSKRSFPGKENHRERTGSVPAQSLMRGRGGSVLGRRLYFSLVRATPKITGHSSPSTEFKKPRCVTFSSTDVPQRQLGRAYRSLDTMRHTYRSRLSHTGRLWLPTLTAPLRAPHRLPTLYTPIPPLGVSPQMDLLSAAHTTARELPISHTRPQMHQVLPLKQITARCKEGGSRKSN
ncbi:tubulin monoglycylase TTLL3 isoform X2 [Brienomyrus brachyistius]|uniref:tubulin monoglycylase TTLL3 isoform X2 n=1 Tax=Brienomyrus brachyistius TaxID=42636 RepID=UPI0020B3F61A|nr:tubulin monoglycylase TTLL3 isoform X2 [Brienomyrus brachyistius]XP_048874454.1 tubulin monoglycylase TTLL3 isoform X2 [Brienomyrus brachyistius]XP_048874455.1 tubulin monoglycylase TTLL3 isoform X2 [Brienomyrus brachyistius]